MAKKKKKSKPRRSPSAALKHEIEPDYMINIDDPKMLRKDTLEGLREVIIFMQGYEKFRVVQDEKVTLFTQLKADVKELHTLIEHKLKVFLPEGKLNAVKPIPPRQEREEAKKVEVVSIKPLKQSPPKVVEGDVPPNELDELEKQLKTIEGQLESIK